MRSVFTTIALSSFFLTTGVLEISARAETPISSTESSSLVPAPATSMTSPIYVAQATTSTSLASLEQAVHNQVNQYRASLGLPPLSLDSRISEQARIHSQNMANGKVPFSHDGFKVRVEAIAKVIPYSASAENVAYNQGYSDPATQAVQGWLKSSGHLTNIKGNYNLTGIGIAKNAKGEYYFTQIFIRSQSTNVTGSTTSLPSSEQTVPTQGTQNPAQPTKVTGSTTSLAYEEKAVHTQVNKYRASVGLPALKWDDRISKQARIHSQNMANGKVAFSHDGFKSRVEAIAKVIPYSGAAENVAYNQGYADPATKAVEGWLKSSGHLANIKGNYNQTGIGIAKNAKGEYYFTQIFIKTRK